MWTVGAETRRRVRKGRIPRRQDLSDELRRAWHEWQRVDPERAGPAVLVFCPRRFFRGGCIFESRTFGAPIIGRFHDGNQAKRLVSGMAANARRREWEAKVAESAAFVLEQIKQGDAPHESAAKEDEEAA